MNKSIEKILTAAFRIAREESPWVSWHHDIQAIRGALMALGIDWKAENPNPEIARLIKIVDWDNYPSFLDEALNSGDGVYRP